MTGELHPTKDRLWGGFQHLVQKKKYMDDSVEVCNVSFGTWTLPETAMGVGGYGMPREVSRNAGRREVRRVTTLTQCSSVFLSLSVCISLVLPAQPHPGS